MAGFNVESRGNPLSSFTLGIYIKGRVDKGEHKAEEIKGKAKQKLGEATDNEQWQAEGKAEHTKSDFKQAKEKLKNAVTDDESED